MNKLCPIMCVIGAIGIGTTVSASEQYVDSSVATKFIHNDNVVLESVDRQSSASGISLLGKIRFGNRTSTRDLGIGLQWEEQLFDEDDFDVSDQRVNIDFTREFDTTNIRLGASYAIQSSRLSELEDTGLLSEQADKEIAKFYGGWNREITQNSTLDVAVVTSDLSFKSNDNIQTPLVGYDLSNITAMITIEKDPRTKWLVGLEGRKFDAPDNRNLVSNSARPLFGVEKRFSQSFTGTASIGYRRTNTRFDDRVNASDASEPMTRSRISHWDPEFTLEGEWRFETAALSLALNRVAIGSATGVQSQRTSLDIDWLVPISPVLNFDFATSIGEIDFTRNNRLSNLVLSELAERLFLKIEPSINWQLSRKLRASLMYRFFKQENVEQTVTRKADSNAIFVGMEYKWL